MLNKISFKANFSVYPGEQQKQVYQQTGLKDREEAIKKAFAEKTADDDLNTLLLKRVNEYEVDTFILQKKGSYNKSTTSFTTSFSDNLKNKTIDEAVDQLVKIYKVLKMSAELRNDYYTAEIKARAVLDKKSDKMCSDIFNYMDQEGIQGYVSNFINDTGVHND